MTLPGRAPQIWIVSGWRGVGKTTLCQRLVAAARLKHWDVAGLLTPARLQAGRKTGIEVEDLRSGERRLLASGLPGELRGMALGRWTIDPAALEWGSQVIARALPCDLLVLDELGRLEFEQGRGWTAGLQALDGGQFTAALAVIRPEYVGLARLRWPNVPVIDLVSVADVERYANLWIDRLSR